MMKVVLTFGMISGAILAGMFALMLPQAMRGVVDFDKSEIAGYTSIVLSMLLVFFGIRSYRNNVGGGRITFGRGVGVGLLITLIACGIYVVTWEIAYYNFIPDFADKYGAHVVAKLRSEGASAAAIAKASQQMATYKRLAANPFINAGMTFMEVFPVGLIVTLVSAAILRKKSAPPPAAAATALA
jgi:hypothetical protein